MFEFGHATHPGLRRQHNEDSYAIDAASGLFVIVDAMGGMGCGESIAAIAREEALRLGRAGTPLDRVIRSTGTVVARFIQERRNEHPAGATLCLLRLNEPDFELAWVGDCTIVLGGTDAACVAEASALPCPESDKSPAPTATALLGRGQDDELHVGLRCGRLRYPSAILLCSDGILEASTPEVRQRALTDHSLSAQESAEHVLLDALDHHARDNLTAVVVRLRR